MSINASVYIICKNEEHHIEQVLQSVKEFDEIIIVDSGSVDKTLEIAKRYTSKIFQQAWLGYAGQKEFAKNLCTHEWVLNLDADEVLSPELKDEIVQTINDNKIDALDIKISSMLLGKFNSPLCKYNRRVRFFRKEKGHYPTKLVHESIVIDGIIQKAKHFIYDYGTPTLSIQIEKINLYSTLRSQEKFSKQKRFSLLKLTLTFPIAFFKSYVIKRGFLNGTRGFISAMNNAYYAYLKEAKLFEKYAAIDSEAL